MSQPSPAEPNASATETESTPRGNRRGTVIVIVVAVAIVGVPLALQVLPVEIAKWHIASAWRSLQADDAEAMTASLNEAERWAPDDSSVCLAQAAVYREAKQYDASLAAVDRALELSGDSVEAYWHRGGTLMQMERFSEAATAFEKVVDSDLGSGPAAASLLNTLAYARALADEDIDAGLDEINQALADSGDGEAAFLDTRGFLYYRKGMYEEALADLNRAVALTNVREARHRVRTQAKIDASFDAEGTFALMLKNLAVMRYHRGLVYEALNQPEKAEHDFDKVRELGFDPNPGLF